MYFDIRLALSLFNIRFCALDKLIASNGHQIVCLQNTSIKYSLMEKLRSFYIKLINCEFSYQAKSCITVHLVTNPENRPDMATILRLPWFQNMAPKEAQEQDW